MVGVLVETDRCLLSLLNRTSALAGRTHPVGPTQVWETPVGVWRSFLSAMVMMMNWANQEIAIQAS